MEVLKIKINSHVGLVIAIAAVLIVSVTALALPVKPANPIGTECLFDSPVNYFSQGACEVYLSATSGSPGTMVTVEALNFRDMPLDTVSAYPTMPSQNVLEYSIHLQQVSSMIPTDIVVASGPVDTISSAGSFSTTLVIPNVAPGTYNVVVTLYTPNADAYSSAFLDYAETATTTFTVT